MQKYQLGTTMREKAGLGTRRVVVTAYAQYLRSSAVYLVEDVDPRSERSSRWVEEGVLEVEMGERGEDRAATDDTLVAVAGELITVPGDLETLVATVAKAAQLSESYGSMNISFSFDRRADQPDVAAVAPAA